MSAVVSLIVFAAVFGLLWAALWLDDLLDTRSAVRAPRSTAGLHRRGSTVRLLARAHRPLWSVR
jgi:hypothetical protein